MEMPGAPRKSRPGELPLMFQKLLLLRHSTVHQRWFLTFATTCGLLLGATFAAAAPFEDTLAQRTLACTACHGAQGRAAPDGYYPRIAGKPAGYLYNQLINFRNGRRSYHLMTQMVEPLSDGYLREIAEYFSALELPYPPPGAVKAAAPELQRGEQLVRHGDAAQRVPACEQCHGTALTGAQPSVPGL